MSQQIQLGDITIDVERKPIKNIHLSVYPPAGRVRIAAPERMELATIRVFAIAKLDWIKAQQRRMRAQEREAPREYLERESHYVWGQRYLLHVQERTAPPSVSLSPTQLLLSVRPGTAEAQRQAILERWYREQLRAAVTSLIAKWEPMMGVKVQRIFVQRMKTRWGSCTPSTGSIRLNTELAKKPRECLEYVVVHELTHLIEPSHNRRFISLMDQFMPHWQAYRAQLNALPVRHETWVD
ncbi:MAG: M48 family peptidase [Candidatus Viridilinea halotolerans]|uniref:M48 family peptidase n=1 Tax=Candidatus Viridilinea halotolerans TaxID=2491704 RepID=A0A426TSK0_9CHLR|nr:MAG: M48 family peptidase [Candidatus Viridilinea halotolerans]